MAVSILSAGTSWFQSRLEGKPLEIRERVFLIAGTSNQEISALSLLDLVRPPRRREWSSLEVIPARHIVVGSTSLQLRATIPPLPQGYAATRIVMLRFASSYSSQRGGRLLHGAVSEAEYGLDGVAVSVSFPEASSIRSVPSRTSMTTRGFAVTMRSTDFITLRPTSEPPPELYGRSILDVWRLAQGLGGVRLIPDGQSVMGGEVIPGFVTGQQGPSGGMRADVALSDSEQLKLLPGIGNATVAKLASNPKPVKTLGEIAFLTQSRYRTLGIKARRAKRLSRLAILMTIVTGADRDGLNAAEVILRVLGWESRSQLESLIRRMDHAVFKRKCSQVERSMVRSGELTEPFSSTRREEWWMSLQRLLKTSTAVN